MHFVKFLLVFASEELIHRKEIKKPLANIPAKAELQGFSTGKACVKMLCFLAGMFMLSFSFLTFPKFQCNKNLVTLFIFACPILYGGLYALT